MLITIKCEFRVSHLDEQLFLWNIFWLSFFRFFVVFFNFVLFFKLFIEVMLLAQNQVGYQMTVAHLCESYVQLTYIPDYM